MQLTLVNCRTKLQSLGIDITAEVGACVDALSTRFDAILPFGISWGYDFKKDSIDIYIPNDFPIPLDQLSLYGDVVT